MTDLRFLFDENLIALGRALRVLYPDEVEICGESGVPRAASDDSDIYPWCRQHGAVLVTYDWNMLRDERILQALLANEGIRVLWIDQIRGESVRKAFGRITGRWVRIRDVLLNEPDVKGLVFRGNNQIVRYRTIGDAVVEVVRRGQRPRNVE